ncbi:Tetrapyrrole methylase family protein [Indibacter alkaliphilus LW1]|jgi:16S rRNA (cytidine1402-2'-O)-methyltransferase|uniref:Tetrapyrrole methylase family protein n=1 Tax=Indibacter alkaliphilus (strain CCUG 57479 / KCTC 22604 / LW1) TaxID=1189612 RepID=S2D081_INDAL|nr:SAM-dependent methyltransferase [Indibacter alkaliphilus]EOZ92279.1 Tetrapyrrole methylase family protein [Indibacter alkaliphilus LW1]
MAKGKLYLIPNVLAENTTDVISPQVKEVISQTQYFLVENVRTARRYISSLRLGLTIENLNFEILDKKTKPVELEKIMQPIFEGKDIGVISEAGCPGIADPGSLAVTFAHQHDIQVVPLSGPSSMFLALMGSGFNGQSFAFHGYLPIQKKERIQAIKTLEAESLKNRMTQIFMETPFRNNHLLTDLVDTLRPDTQLCIAKNLTGSDEMIQTKSVQDWKRVKIDLHKIPTVFVLYSA